MANNMVEKVILATNNKKSNRPDGLDIDRYKGINDWTYRRWAWEFLRRNDDFIKECDRVELGTDKEKFDVARKFGLKEFKSYRESDLKKTGAPKFSLDSIFIWSNLGDVKRISEWEKIRIGKGQVIIRFDLASAMDDERVLERQLSKAKRQLDLRMAKYIKLTQKKTNKHSPKAVKFGIYIRLLDYLASGKKHDECAALIYPERVKDGLTKDEMRDLVKNPIKAARCLAKENYIFLSLRDGIPEGKEIMLKS